MADQASERTTVTPGLILGGCRILRFIGRGGMGEVYYAVHLALERPVAVKVLPPGKSEPEMIRRFLKEARTCSRIEHPNVITIHDVGEEAGLYYIVMRFVDGKNLAQLVHEQRGPLPWKAAVKLVRGAANGLSAVHGRGLIHRDIKPANIMLASDAQILLMDFGLVRDQSDSSASYSFVGTPKYMSPEQCLGRELDDRSDVYSLGATFYFLLTGQNPFRGTTGEVISQIISNQRPEPICELVPSVPSDVAALVDMAMAHDPKQRYSDAKSFSRALGDILRRYKHVGPPPEDTAPIAAEPVSTISIPELELLDSQSVDESREIEWQTQPWMIGGGIVIALLLVAFVVNLLTIPSLPPSGTDSMVQIPAGTVILGNEEPEIRTYIGPHTPDQKRLDQLLSGMTAQPPTQADVEEFWIDAYEVTNAEYAEFVRATGHTAPSHWVAGRPPAGKENHPVVNILYKEAEAYARWRGKALPTHEQWVRAYRGDTRHLFPWGNDYHVERANLGDNPTFPSTSPVTATPDDVTPFGVYNMVGNAAEFVRGTVIHKNTPCAMVKGGSYPAPGYAYGNASFVVYQTLDSRAQDGGFRCVIQRR